MKSYFAVFPELPADIIRTRPAEAQRRTSTRLRFSFFAAPFYRPIRCIIRPIICIIKPIRCIIRQIKCIKRPIRCMTLRSEAFWQELRFFWHSPSQEIQHLCFHIREKHHCVLIQPKPMSVFLPRQISVFATRRSVT